MRRGVLVAGGLVVLVGAGAALTLVGGESERPGVEVVSPVIARNVAARTSIGLPGGWQELPRVATTDPVQVLVVGTVARPDAEPINPCDASSQVPPGAAFVSIYEYLTGARLNSPDHTTVYDATQFVSRPADFATAPSVSSGFLCRAEPELGAPPAEVAPSPGATAPTAVSSENRIADYTFLDGGRFFVARVVSTGDRDGARFDEAIAVLNTLEIAVPPEVTTTTGPGLAPSTAVPVEEQEVAREQITDALRGAFGGGGPVTGDEAITGGFPLGEGSRETAAETHQEFIGVIVPRVNWLTLDSATNATVNFDLLIDGQTITANTTGEAIFLDGRWKVTAETFCTIVRRGNVTCPAP